MSAGENPPAFPLPSVAISDHGVAHANPGMSLRDYFAGQALAAIAGLHHGNDWGPDGKDHAPRCARKAYAIADAMLATRTGSAEQ
jgi:hypothetical protein